MKHIVYFHRNIKAGYSIEKVSRPYIEMIAEKSVHNMPCERATPFAVLKNLLFIFKRRNKKSIHHITGDIHYGLLALCGRKTVLTIHDTGIVDFSPSVNGLKRYLTKLLWFKIPLKLADRVVCISETTKKHVSKYTKRDDILVVHNSVDSKIKFHAKPDIDGVVKVLLIGSNPNKNIERQFEALAGIDCVVTIIGNLSDAQTELLKKLNITFYNKYDLTDEQVYNEYYINDIVLFCSLSEGFGMPLVEANKAGTPVICSDIPVLHEVGSDAAYFVDPTDISKIREAVIKIKNDNALRQQLITNGIQNAERFDIEKIYPKWEDIYKSLS